MQTIDIPTHIIQLNTHIVAPFSTCIAGYYKNAYRNHPLNLNIKYKVLLQPLFYIQAIIAYCITICLAKRHSYTHTYCYKHKLTKAKVHPNY